MRHSEVNVGVNLSEAVKSEIGVFSSAKRLLEKKISKSFLLHM